MFATHYHTAYIPDVMDKVLNIEELTKSGCNRGMRLVTCINKYLGSGQEWEKLQLTFIA